MPLYNIPNSTTGMDAILVDTSTAVPSFIPMLLIFVFFTILIGGSTSQRRRTGYSDMPLWGTLASIATLMLALPMTLVVGIISRQTLTIIVSMTILCGFWFFMSRGRYES